MAKGRKLGANNSHGNTLGQTGAKGAGAPLANPPDGSRANVAGGSSVKKFRSLTITLALAFLVLNAVILFVSNSLNAYFNFLNLQDVIATQHQLIAENAAKEVSGFVQGKVEFLKKAVFISDLATASLPNKKNGLEKILGKEISFRQLVFFNLQAQEVLRASRISQSMSTQLMKCNKNTLFTDVDGKGMHISSIYIDQISYEPMLVIAVPVLDVFGETKGILVAELNLKFMWDLVDKIQIGETGVAYVVDKQGNLVAFRDISRVLKGENLCHLSEVNKFVKGDLATHKSNTQVTKGIHGTKVVANHEHLVTPDWAVMIEMPVKEAYGSVIQEVKLSFGSMGAGLFLAILFGIYLSRRVTKPVRDLCDTTKRISQGNLNVTAKVQSSDEIGELAVSFNEMTENLKRTTTSIDNLNQEIKERKRIEKELRLAEEKYRIQFEGALDAIFVADAETGIIVDCNPAATKLVGRQKAEILGRYQRILHPPEEIEGEVSRSFGEHQKNPDQSIETQIVTKEGEIRDVAIKASLLEIRGKKVMQGIFRDITDHKRSEARLSALMEELSRSNQELQRFAYVASHDLQEPLRMITSYLQLLEKRYKEKLDKDAQDFIDFAVDGAARMRRLVVSLLEYSRIETRGTEFAAINMEKVLEKAMKNLEVSIDERQAKMTHEPLPQVVGEEGQLVQLLQNLIGNALKFCRDEVPVVHVSAKQEADYVLFGVRDNGIGIAPEYRERIFQIFQRLHTQEEYKGTGIGLAVCKKIVERHGGKIWIESEIGKGTTFCFTIKAV